jgi:hypothetical protein
MGTIVELLDRLWQDYAAMNPQARQIHDLLSRRGERVVNDHIALRTFDTPCIGLNALANPFIHLGYEPRGRYVFPEKKLLARHYEHPEAGLPRVFISELRLSEFSPALRDAVDEMVHQMPADLPESWDFPAAGRPWKLAYDLYERLRTESEYAAWMAAFGFRANHFTVAVNALTTFADLRAFNEFLKANGFALNAAGGEIKGSPQDLLEQSSTLASQVRVDFTDGPHMTPGCYYEFARRHPLPDGRLFSGFVEKSADKIFESTNKR